MKKALLVLGIIIVVLAVTNPSLESHKQEVTKVITGSVKEDLKDNPFAALGVMFASKMVESMVSRDNYIIFSLTRISAFGESKIAGYGILGTVYLSEDLKDKIKENRN